MNINYFTGFDSILDDDRQNKALESFVNLLPHGSGINCDWGGHKSKNGRFVRFINSYHCMDEYGGYDGWQDFTILIPTNLFDYFISVARYIDKSKALATLKIIADLFVLEFNGDRYLSDKHMLREYLQDMIYHAFTYEVTL